MTFATSTRTVVKLGGSLLSDAARLREIAQVLASAPRAGSLVLVPGGGPFAEAVQTCQTSLGLDDGTAHEMAMLAMGLFGRLLMHLTGFAGVSGAQALATTAGAPVVWLPDPDRDAAALPRSWDTTSDSLALWLADQMGADTLILVKSATTPPQLNPDALCALGIVDRYYPTLCRQTPRVDKRFVFDSDAQALRKALAAAR